MYFERMRISSVIKRAEKRHIAKMKYFLLALCSLLAMGELFLFTISRESLSNRNHRHCFCLSLFLLRFNDVITMYYAFRFVCDAKVRTIVGDASKIVFI